MRRDPLWGLKSVGILAALCIGIHSQQPRIENRQRDQAVLMLSNIHDAVRKSYYDPTFHGVDIDARYKTYEERVKKSETLADAYRVVAAYLSGLDDSHTFFVPPRRSYLIDYGYRMQMVGNTCFITEVRPGSDAAGKLHPGDQVLSLDGYSVGRKDMWQLTYYLNQIAPKPTTEFVLRSPSGEVRKVQVVTKYVQGKHVKDLTFENSDNDFWNLILDYEKQQSLLAQRWVIHDDVMIWKMPTFTLEENDVDRMVHEARKHKTLILDLRGNPGGYVTSLERMVGSFFDRNVTIYDKKMRNSTKTTVAKSRGGSAFSGQLFVLVDSGSASAAELFARVVQLEHRGTVVGDLTSGGVMEAQVQTFQTGLDIVVLYGASITRADLIMADGKSLEKTGVTPDVIVLPTASQLANREDPALAKAAELAGIKLDSSSAGKLFPFEWAPI